METPGEVFLRDVNRPLTDFETEQVEAVLNAAYEWVRGRLDWRDAVRVGAIPRPGTTEPHSGYTRFIATLYASRTDPRREALMAFLDFLIRTKGKTIYKGQVYDPVELRDSDARIDDLKRRGLIRTYGRHDDDQR